MNVFSVQERIDEVVVLLKYIDKYVSCKTQIIVSNSESGFEGLVVKLNVLSRDLFIAVFYRPPNLSLQGTSIMCDIIRSFQDMELILMGDFNLGEIDWLCQKTVNPLGSSEAFELLEVVDDLFLFQHVTQSSRPYSSTDRILDLIFTRERDSLDNFMVKPPLRGSDHNMFLFDFKLSFYMRQSEVVYLYNKIDHSL